MSLATRCPFCHTTFRVTHDQLKLRGGLVRCGSCKEIFNGVEHLLPATQAEPPPAAPQPSPANTANTANTAAAEPQQPSQSRLADSTSGLPVNEPSTVREDIPGTASRQPANLTAEDRAHIPVKPERLAPSDDDRSATPADGASQQQPSAHAAGNTTQPATGHPWPDMATTSLPEDLDPLTRMTLMDIRPDPLRDDQRITPHLDKDGGTGPEVDEISRAIEDLQSRPWRGTRIHSDMGQDEIDALDNDEPEFVRHARLQQARGKRMHLAMVAGSIVLALLAIVQAVFAFRTEIAAKWPATMPVLARLCQPLGCEVGMPARIESVTIESHELQVMPASDNTFTLGMLLRNRSNVVQAWPHLQLTLVDPAGEPIVRRVLAPAEYLGTGDHERGLGASSERPVRVTFTVTQLKASGYVLHLFYP